MRKIALIPAYKPDGKLIDILKELIQNKIYIVVVDDGSGKEYKKIFEDAKKYSNVISYDENKGKGYALKTGLKYMKENFNDEYIVITMDSDGQHTVKDLLKLVDYIEDNPDDVALGMRKRDKTGIPLRSRIGNGITRLVYKMSTGVSIYDTQTGLRAFTNKLIDMMLDIEGNRYEYEMNVLLECPRLKINMKEIEIETIYLDNNETSHFRPIRDSIRIYKKIIKFAISSLIAFITDYLLYAFFVLLFGNITIANISARVISGVVNYVLNKKVVFKSNGKVYESALQYTILAVFLLTVNTLILNGLVFVFGINEMIAKIIVEFALFLFSWIIQRRIIFNKTKIKKAGK